MSTEDKYKVVKKIWDENIDKIATKVYDSTPEKYSSLDYVKSKLYEQVTNDTGDIVEELKSYYDDNHEVIRKRLLNLIFERTDNNPASVIYEWYQQVKD